MELLESYCSNIFKIAEGGVLGIVGKKKVYYSKHCQGGWRKNLIG